MCSHMCKSALFDYFFTIFNDFLQFLTIFYHFLHFVPFFYNLNEYND